MDKMEKAKTRIAAYIRIGGSGEWFSTFEMQKAHFVESVAQRSGWELAEIYADVGTDSRKQPNLHRLLADCRAGRIDLVVTKSTSRISRDLNTLMSVVRELAYLKPPVGVLFEDTGLNTLSQDHFLFLTMFGAMAIRDREIMTNAFLTKKRTRKPEDQHE